MVDLKILVVVPATADVETLRHTNQSSVLVVRNVEEAIHVRGHSVYRVLMVGLSAIALHQRLHEAYMVATATYAEKFGERPKLQAV